MRDLPIDWTKQELKQILGRPVGTRFIEWYRQDWKGTGYTIPFMKYSGPGNPTNIGEPANEADKFAKIHDLQYAHASYRFQNKWITKSQFEADVSKSDSQFLTSNGYNITGSMDPREQLASVIGGLGIGIKKGAESVIGQQYPDVDPSKSFTPHPPGENKLANQLMKNLKSNSSRVMSGRAGSPERKVAKLSTADTPSKGGSIPSASQPAAAPVPAPPVPPPEVEMGLTGTGKEQASGGASSDGMAVHTVPRPITIFGHKESVYTKVHKFMTFGFADNIIATDVTGLNLLTSYFAEIPWHIPATYLNPSEFDLIPNGSHIKSVHIEVTYRGSVIQFQTNSSATGLATLNQINDISVANGLNRTGWGSNVSYTGFDANQPMIPTSYTVPKYDAVTGTYRGMVRDYYGSSNSNANFPSDIPKHQTGRQTFLYNYWGTTQRDALTGTVAQNHMFGGWPCLAEKIEQMDGKTVVNQVVLSSSYQPKLAPIKSPLKMQNHGLPYPKQNEEFIIPCGGNLPASRYATVIRPNITPTASLPISNKVTETTIALDNFSDEPSFTIYSPIEKCQMGRSGFWGQNDVHIQPSIHIGVQPVPALSTAALLAENAAFNAWTDTRAYWEVKATMVVSEYQPTAWPYAAKPNIPAGDVIMWNPTGARPVAIMDAKKDGATFAGLYTMVPLE